MYRQKLHYIWGLLKVHHIFIWRLVWKSVLKRTYRKRKLVIYRIVYPIRYRFRENVHILHINKTGGTALKYALKPHPVTQRYVIVLHRHRTKLRDIPRGDRVFFFLRDPLTRFSSGFYSRKQPRKPDYYPDQTADEKIAYEYFETPNSLATALSSEDAQERERAIKAMHSIRHVQRHCWEWFESKSYFLSRLPDIFFIGFQENLTEDFEGLKSKLGLPSSVELPTDDKNAHRNPPHIDKRLDEKAITNLKNWYAKDYEFIELCKHYIAEINAGEKIDASRKS